MIQKKCEICGKAFSVINYRAKTAKFCSMACKAARERQRRIGKHLDEKTKNKISATNSKPKIKQICVNCKKEFFVNFSQSKRRSCCSRKCRNEYQRIIFKGIGNIHWKGGRRLRPDGYIECFVGGERRKYQLEHRLIIEKNIGRKLKQSEDVHHINGDKTDNRIENLLLILKSEHTKLHNRPRFQRSK